MVVFCHPFGVFTGRDFSEMLQLKLTSQTVVFTAPVAGVVHNFGTPND